MEPKIIDSPAITLVGFSFYGDPLRLSAGWTEENEVGRLWSRFMPFFQANQEHIQHLNEDAAYEAHIEHPETAETGQYEVFLGVAVEQVENLPLELLIKVLPPTKYAVFTISGALLPEEWALEVYGEWLPQSGYEAKPYMFWRYDERYKGLDHLADSELEVYVPLESPHE
ncbi:MAG: GyrI-like domain-containing protein [Anaerolineales bacterium]|nr:GyrI-like domain-containing protein [Anaerolineales bacterium]